MDGLFRRPSGIYFARLVVPERLRALVGKVELIATTGVRDAALARIVGGQILVGWRDKLMRMDNQVGSATIDPVRLKNGSPGLAVPSFVGLEWAAQESGLTADLLLQEAAAGHLKLFVRVAGLEGHRLALADLEVDRALGAGSGSYVIPPRQQIPSTVPTDVLTGVVQLSEPKEIASILLTRGTCTLVALPVHGDADRIFVPDKDVVVTKLDLLVATPHVERVRARYAAAVKPEHIEAAKRVIGRDAPAANPLHDQPIAESIQSFLADHKKERGAEQARRIQTACELFVELMGAGLKGKDLTRKLMRQYRDQILPSLPANENKVRLQHGSGSMLESIEAIKGTAWPRLSAEQQVKQIKWVCQWLDWLAREGWSPEGVSTGIAGGGTAGRASARASKNETQLDRRQPFDDSNLAAIFGAAWFKLGKGTVTTRGSYRGWMAYHYWMPLLGAYAGGRINEIAQLDLRDIYCNEAGVWMLRFEGEVDSAAPKRVKNKQSRREVPVHSQLRELGLLRYVDALTAAGHTKLFPELRLDQVKGYGKSATKWFSGYMKSLGVARDGRLVFHSFRHTFGTRLEHTPNIKSATVSQLMGHERGETTTLRTYRQDEVATHGGNALVQAVESLNYAFSTSVAAFDVEAGLKATNDALDRKRSARPGGRRPPVS